MVRDFFVSLTGHIAVFGGFLFSSTLASIQPSHTVTIQQITLVTPQQIAQLQRQGTVQGERVSIAPQIPIKEDEKIPNPTRRKRQALKQTSTSLEPKPGKEQKGSPIQGIQTDTEFSYPD